MSQNLVLMHLSFGKSYHLPVCYEILISMHAGWCQRIKSEFKFEYAYLEDELGGGGGGGNSGSGNGGSMADA